MSARLTKAQRAEFVDAVMEDVPKIDYQEKARVMATKAVIAALPSSVRRVYDDESTRPFIEMQTPHLDLPTPVRDQHGMWRRSFGISAPGKSYQWVLQVAEHAIVDLKVKWAAQDEKLAALRLRLATVAGSCTTRAALAEALPDFVKYMPPELDEPARNLPALATSVAHDFKAAGFPK